MATTSEAPPKAPGRAGRNLPAAIAVGLALGAAIIGSVYSPARWTFVVIVIAALLLGTSGVVRALRTLGAKPPLVPLLIGGAAMIGLAYRNGPDDLVLVYLLTVLGVVLWRLGDSAGGGLRGGAGGGFPLGSAPLPGRLPPPV